MDSAACYRVLQARDARFDGHFFTGVRSTGIYCRPVCNVRIPMEKNRIFCATYAGEGGRFLSLFALPARTGDHSARPLPLVDAGRGGRADAPNTVIAGHFSAKHIKS